MGSPDNRSSLVGTGSLSSLSLTSRILLLAGARYLFIVHNLATRWRVVSCHQLEVIPPSFALFTHRLCSRHIIQCRCSFVFEFCIPVPQTQCVSKSRMTYYVIGVYVLGVLVLRVLV